MTKARNTRILWTFFLTIIIYLFSFPAEAKYGGGTGEPNDPYQIATAEDLVLLGDSPEDYDKNFILTADINLDPNLPGRKVLDRAIIGHDTNDEKGWFQGIPFTGAFDGNGHTISHLTIAGVSYLGLFGLVDDGAVISNLGLEAIDIEATGDYVGGLVGVNLGSIIMSYSTGTITGVGNVGGLVGLNYKGSIMMSYSTSTIAGVDNVGGLVGKNSDSITTSYSTGIVSGDLGIGGLVGENSYGSITSSYSTGTVIRGEHVGGLVGENWHGSIDMSYSTGSVYGNEPKGGFVGSSNSYSSITLSFWDIETSGLTNMCGKGLCDDSGGKTTVEMQDPNTYLNVGWDFVDEGTNGDDDIWVMSDPSSASNGYPIFSWQIGSTDMMVFVSISESDFSGQMSKYETTNSQYCQFLNDALASGDITVNDSNVIGASGSNSGTDYIDELYYNCDGSGYTRYGATQGGAARIKYDGNDGMFSVDSGFEKHPVTYVSWYGAMAFCNYYGYRLPTEVEWQAVADFDGSYRYGCGSNISHHTANYMRSFHPDGTTAVGSFDSCGYGVCDMAGNVYEWMNVGHILRGGSWCCDIDNCTVSNRLRKSRSDTDHKMGFRVCR